MTEFNLQASLKDADGDMINFRAQAPEELAAYLSNFPWQQYHDAKAQLRATGNAAPLGQPAPQQQYQQPAQQAPQQQAWGGQQQGGYQPQGNVQTHPEGKVCEMCSKPLEAKRTQNGKNVWRCPDWRWSNGNPNGHTNIFA